MFNKLWCVHLVVVVCSVCVCGASYMLCVWLAVCVCGVQYVCVWYIIYAAPPIAKLTTEAKSGCVTSASKEML